MLPFYPKTRQASLRQVFLFAMVCLTVALPAAGALAAEETEGKEPEQKTRLIDRPAFDRITLDEANQNAVFEVSLLDLPNHQLPDPFPRSGVFDLRRLSDPSVPYQVPWTSIRKIDLYEQMLLDEAMQLTRAKNSWKPTSTSPFSTPIIPGFRD